ncbi:hypothetical protein [Streptomyces platensis]
MSSDKEDFRAFHAEFTPRLPNESSLRTTATPWFLHQLRVIADTIQNAADQVTALPAQQKGVRSAFE